MQKGIEGHDDLLILAVKNGRGLAILPGHDRCGFLYINSYGGTAKSDGIASIPFESLKKLLRRMQDTPYSIEIDADALVIQSSAGRSNFRYCLNLKAIPRIAGVDLGKLKQLLDKDTNERYNLSMSLEQAMLEISGNYFQDKAAAIEAGIIAPNAMPKKAALVELIEAHNAAQQPEVEQPKESDEFLAMLAKLAEADRAADAEKIATLPPRKQRTAKSQSKKPTPEEKRAMVASKNLATWDANVQVQAYYSQFGPKRASVIMAEAGRPMAPATVGQINATMRIIQSSKAIRYLFENGYVKWSYLYHLRHVVIERLEAQLLAMNGVEYIPQAQSPELVTA